MLDCDYCSKCGTFLIFEDLSANEQLSCPTCSMVYVCDETYFEDEGIVRSLLKHE
jgi:hypothetical protein